jgi:cell wall-associated NlpC family hydrolase
LAIATAIAESGLHNLRRGDRDSLGLFQQRPSQGWGPAPQILDPATATNHFLTHLLTVPRWAALPAGAAEQTVQHSAHPAAYAPAEAPAAHLVEHYWSNDQSPTPPAPSGQTLVWRAAFEPARCPDQRNTLAAPTPPRPPSAGTELPADPTARTAATTAVRFALAQVGKPYLWGAHGPEAFDCSGLVHAAWAAAGVSIGRTTLTQIHDGTPIADLHQIEPGDLLFIPGDEGTRAQPRHVGLYAGHNRVINAYDSSKGIVIEPLARWAPKIVAIRRLTLDHPM